MNFNADIFKQLLSMIEYRLAFSTDGIKEPTSFDLKCDIDIEEIYNLLNQNGQKCKLNELKYYISILKQLNYIEIKNGYINKITSNGYRMIIYLLHKIDLKY